jgi:hypothetical protein
MKRILLAALSASLLAFGVPSVAAAHHGKRHAACRASTHRHHAKCAHARAHVLSFGPTRGAGTTSASSPSTPTSPSTETAGTVASFVAPLLTITLNDKTEVSGKVTERTRIECESPAPSGEGDDGDDDGGGEDGDSRIGADSHGDLARTPVARSAQDDEGQGDEQGEDEDSVQPCTESALVAGALVRSAELLIGGEGAVWEKVVLVS